MNARSRHGLLVALAFAALGLLGCSDSSKPGGDAPTTGSGRPMSSIRLQIASIMPPATASATASPGSERGKMVHCPSAVEGASTDIQDVDGGITVTVTSKDADKTKEIRERSKFLADASKNETPGAQHNGTGAGGGAFGRCPIVNRNTTVEAADVDGGSKLTVKPKSAAELDWLRRESRERLKEIGEPGGKEAGQGKMAHCPSAIENTTTVVKATKDAVIVTVTAKDDATTKEIRERAKLLAEAAKKDPASVDHKGDGSGGGGFGRCPVILKDTTVTMKDVPNGSEFTVKPKTPAEVPALEKEAKDRADKLARFAPGAAPSTSASAAPSGSASAAPGKK